MKKLIGRIALAGMLVLQSSLLPAAENVTVPGQVQFAGRIFTTEDTEGTEGIRGVTFSLFAEQSGGAALWVENQIVSVSGDGGYNTLLGAETQGGIPQSIFASGEARWLEVSYTGADGATITQPRVLLVSVPYALKAGDAATLGGLPVSAFVLNTDAVASRVSDNGGLPGATVTDVLPSAAVTAGRIAKFNSALATDVVDSIITEASGKIGIGTTTPVGTIDVGGWASIPGDIQGVGSTISGDVFMGNTNGGIGRFRMASNALQGFFSWNQYYNGTNHKGMDATAPGWRVNIGGTGAEDAYYVERSPATAGGHVPARLFVVNGNGNVGINTGGIAPISTLDVGGWPDKPVDIVGVGSTISGDAFMGNVGGNSGRYRMASNGNQGFFSWNQYYNGTVHKGMDATAPGWRINVGGKGVEDAFYVERSPATAGTHVPARLFQVSGSGNVGIGTIAPTAKLDVVGSVKATGFQLVDGNQAASKVLTSDANGNATWQDAPGGGGGATLGANTFTDTQTISSGNLALSAPGGATSGVITSGGLRYIYRVGTSNSFFGAEAGNFTFTGAANTAVGYQAAKVLATGTSNTVVGSFAMSAATTAHANTAVGEGALFHHQTGSNNTAIGGAAGFNQTSGNDSTYLGAFATQGGAGNFTNATAVGFRAAVGASNSLVLGSINGVNGATADTKVGIGTTTPTERLDVGGHIQLSGSLMLPFTNASGAGTITFGPGNRFMHAYGSGNAFLGFNSGNLTMTGNANTAIGSNAFQLNTEGYNNTAMGSTALNKNTTGFENTAVGKSALVSNQTGFKNTALGALAMLDNVSGTGNVAVGNDALGSNDSHGNTGVGNAALFFNTSGAENVALGGSALRSSATGLRNTGVGYAAGYTSDFANANVSGSQNTFIGAYSGPGTATQLTNATAIGARAVVNTSNSLVLGAITGINFGTSVNVGIGTHSPVYRLHVQDSPSGTEGVIQVGPTSTAAGAKRVQFGDTSLGSCGGPCVYVGEAAATDDRMEVFGRNRADVISDTNPVTIRNSTSSAGLRLQVLGDIRVGTSGTNGCVQRFDGAGLTGTCSSDIRFKKDIRPLGSLLDRVVKLEPVSYLWRADEFPEKRFGTSRVNGLIAQQVEEVLPELVSTDEEGYKRINLSELPLLAIQSIKELKAENDILNARLAARDSQVSDLATKADAQQSEISELREMLMSLQRQLGTQVSKAVTSGH